MLELLLIFACGVGAGIITGLTPGFHPNNLVFLLPVLLLFFGPVPAGVFLVSAGAVNVLVGFIPSIFLGAPEADSVMSVLPGHRLLKKGLGTEAVLASANGAVYGGIFSVILLPVFSFIFPMLYKTIRPSMHWLLLFFMIYMFATEKGWGRIISALIFLLSGLIGLGFLGFGDTMLFPLLTGFFALPMLFISIFRPQDKREFESGKKLHVGWKPAILGSLSGIFAGLLPGIGSSQAAVIIESIEPKEEEFLSALGSLNISDMIYSFMALWIVSNPRSGIAVAVGKILEINISNMVILLASILAAVFAGYFIVRLMVGKFEVMLKKIDYGLLSGIVLIFLVTAISITTGVYGLVAAGAAASVGAAAAFTGVRRSSCMGCLILPTMLFFAGL
ncbi:MAG: tripartite tricarboxylate transporter permease [Candidatus Aenigmarchaeota archaeon]|nr:tripartite tricarboxylate transporter permease [Candidatus Aenigmarchaeota archaeon]